MSRRVRRSESAWALPRASARAVAKLANSTVKKQPDVESDEIAHRHLAARAGEDCLHDEQQRQNGADLDHKHDRILPLDVRPQHDERLLERGAHQFRRQQALDAESGAVAAGGRGAGFDRRWSAGTASSWNCHDAVTSSLKWDQRSALSRRTESVPDARPPVRARPPAGTAGRRRSGSSRTAGSRRWRCRRARCPTVNGVRFFAARLAAMAIGAMIGR